MTFVCSAGTCRHSVTDGATACMNDGECAETEVCRQGYCLDADLCGIEQRPCDPTGPDQDGDGVLDDADNCPEVANADQADQDGDERGDRCDPDRDGDGVLNDDDACADHADPDQVDTDGDGAGDACDPDDDGDGVADDADNCSLVANADQADADNDGVGDACDEPNIVDADGDGVADATDNCPDVANPRQEDSDGDALGDACDDDPETYNFKLRGGLRWTAGSSAGNDVKLRGAGSNQNPGALEGQQFRLRPRSLRQAP